MTFETAVLLAAIGGLVLGIGFTSFICFIV